MWVVWRVVVCVGVRKGNKNEREDMGVCPTGNGSHGVWGVGGCREEGKKWRKDG